MNVFKFGGASVRDAKGVRNVLKVLQSTGAGRKVVVVSAMGKMTNALEEVVFEYLTKGTYTSSLQQIKEFHQVILNELFENNSAPVYAKVKSFLEELQNFLDHNKSTRYDFVYDQVVCYGELLSTTIVCEFLIQNGVENIWVDARNFIKTDDTYRDAQVLWPETQSAISGGIEKDRLSITQGFIGADGNNFTTTLGREGSDYTAAIFAYCLNAESVTIWKDVPGVLNGDPRVFQDTQLLNQISYEEAIELAFYGASVIHPKTLQPLQRKEIPLFVKSFLKPENNGTAV
ncbi:MAG TPA: aspartate kinase, partial [Salinimicrobium sp.]|nr:aspartate kinase [Salinimicrobium sp.]